MQGRRKHQKQLPHGRQSVVWSGLPLSVGLIAPSLYHIPCSCGEHYSSPQWFSTRGDFAAHTRLPPTRPTQKNTQQHLEIFLVVTTKRSGATANQWDAAEHPTMYKRQAVTIKK